MHTLATHTHAECRAPVLALLSAADLSASSMISRTFMNKRQKGSLLCFYKGAWYGGTLREPECWCVYLPGVGILELHMHIFTMPTTWPLEGF
jgi:hypothetical protein